MSLDIIRSKIDLLDEQITVLLEARFLLVLEMKTVKSSLDDPMREKEILARIDSEYIQNVYKEIFRNSKKLLQNHGFVAAPSDKNDVTKPSPPIL